ncbi:MAG: hypothetical protein EOO81_07510 [Oxalobacteraceae bacterium]|nr:MAG: hypothetical protein EOO81_07510 [Oxalobacteraceae bacterium]
MDKIHGLQGQIALQDAIALAGGLPGPLQGRVSAKNIVYFDLETQRSFGDVGGFSNKSKMGVSVAVTYSTARGGYEIYGENEMEKLGEELVRADLVVGWNHIQFDYPVLQPYVFHTLTEQTINLDMMLELEIRGTINELLVLVGTPCLRFDRNITAVAPLRCNVHSRRHNV